MSVAGNHPTLKLGLRPPTPGRRKLKLRKYLTGLLPAHPQAADYFSGVSFGMYTNDQFGVCGPTDIANSRRQITARLTGTMQAPTQDDVYDLYRRSGNPNFNPSIPDDDPRQDSNGVNMQQMLDEVVRNGIGGVKALGFAAVDVSDLEELKAAIAIFGTVHFGVNLQQIQQQQTDTTHVWDYRPSYPWGGHAIPGVGYGTNIVVESWAQAIQMTPRFIQHQASEGYVVIWKEHLTDLGFMAGVNLQAFAADFQLITGRPFPVSIPAPVHPPAPVGGDPYTSIMLTHQSGKAETLKVQQQ